MKFLILIPARKGSKRIKGKNTKKLYKKPLIYYTLKLCKNLPSNFKVIVSTDDKKIKKITKKFKFVKIIARPKNLCGDNISSAKVALHVLKKLALENYFPDGIILLQVTSPFRSPKLIYNGVKMFKKTGENPIVSFSEAKNHPWQTYKFERKNLRPFFKIKNIESRNFRKPPAFAPNGSFYCIRCDDLKKWKTFYPQNLTPLFIKNSFEAVDIDTAEDWKLAELIAKKIKKHD